MQGATAPVGLVTQCLTTGCTMFDFVGGNFLIKIPGGSATRYDWSTFYSAMSGAMTSSEKWVYNAQGVLVKFAANTPAAPSFNGNLQTKGWTLEYPSKNWILWSSDLSNAAWIKTGVVRTDSARLAPTNLQLASLITEDDTIGNHWVEQSITKSTDVLTYTASCNMAPSIGARNMLVYIDDGTGVNAAYAIYGQDIFDEDNPVTTPAVVATIGSYSEPVAFLERSGTSGLARISVRATTSAATTVRFACGMADGETLSYEGGGTDFPSAADVWGMQLEQRTTGVTERALFPSTYIETTTVAVDRILDQATMQLPVGLQSLSEYSMYLNVFLPTASNLIPNSFVSLANADETERVYLNQTSPSTSGRLAMTLVLDGLTDGIATQGPLNVYNQRFGLAAQLRSGGWWVKNSGSAFSTAANSSVFEAPVQLRFNADNTGQNGSGNAGYIQYALFAGLAQVADRETLSSFLFTAPPANPDVNELPNYFTQGMVDDITPSSMVTFRSGVFPTANDITPNNYRYYPTHVLFNNAPNIGLFAPTVTDTWFAYRMWGLRCDTCIGARPNEVAPQLAVGDKAARVSITSIDLSIWAQISQGLYILGFPQNAGGPCTAPLVYCGWEDAAVLGGGLAPSDIIHYADALADPEGTFPGTYLQYRVATNKVFLAPARFPDATTPNVWGIFSVSEQADERSAAQMLFLNEQMAAMSHQMGYKYGTSTDDLLGSGAAAGYCGWSTAMVTSTADLTVGTPTLLNMPNVTNIGVGQRLRGTGIPTQATVLSLTSNSVTLDRNVISSGTGLEITSPNGQSNCETVNLPQIAAAVDFILPSVSQPPPRNYTFQQNLNAQIVLFGPPGVSTYPADHLGFTFGMGQWPGGTSPADAQIARDLYIANGMGGQLYSSGLAGWGGGQCRWTNLKLQILMGLSTGDCDLTP